MESVHLLEDISSDIEVYVTESARIHLLLLENIDIYLSVEKISYEEDLLQQIRLQG